MAGAARIIGIDLHSGRFEEGESLIVYMHVCFKSYYVHIYMWLMVLILNLFGSQKVWCY